MDQRDAGRCLLDVVRSLSSQLSEGERAAPTPEYLAEYRHLVALALGEEREGRYAERSERIQAELRERAGYRPLGK